MLAKSIFVRTGFDQHIQPNLGQPVSDSTASFQTSKQIVGLVAETFELLADRRCMEPDVLLKAAERLLRPRGRGHDHIDQIGTRRQPCRGLPDGAGRVPAKAIGNRRPDIPASRASGEQLAPREMRQCLGDPVPQRFQISHQPPILDGKPRVVLQRPKTFGCPVRGRIDDPKRCPTFVGRWLVGSQFAVPESR